ncbi:hypothetical protein [uncultured Tenacibaculum sp.]|uniref:hypothetical protein n=1 Tax=uncultured Tenacibaculum sp. TaxID=174713 RepID=UPI002603A2DD|nr:hypothetical protein [uncultured Tenacibaculum sp.]
MKQNKETLKAYFETGDKPTQQQYSDLVDSYIDAKQPTGEPNRRFVIDENGEVSVASKLNIPEYTLSEITGNKLGLLKDGVVIKEINLNANSIIIETEWEDITITSNNYSGTLQVKRIGDIGYIRGFNFSGGGASSFPFNFAVLPLQYRPNQTQYRMFNGHDNIIKQLKITKSTGQLSLNQAATAFNEFLVSYHITI